MNITSRHIITYFILSVFIFSSVGVTFHSSCCEGNKEKEFEKGELSCCEEIIIEETEEKLTKHNDIEAVFANMLMQGYLAKVFEDGPVGPFG